MDGTQIRTILISMALLTLTAFPAAFAGATPKGDPGRGQQIYGLCLACHTVDQNRVGPRTAGVVGRRVGSVPGFNYSPALREAGAAGLVWDEKMLDKFLESPAHFLPGTRMSYDGIKDPQQRADLIAYLRTLGSIAQRHAKTE